jgi:predicted metal-dependent hydrolase
MLFEYCWKYYDWKYEKEYRAISFGDKDFNRKLPFEIEDVEEIYIGNRLEKEKPEFYESLIKILKRKYSKVKLFKVKPNPLVVKLEFEEFNTE